MHRINIKCAYCACMHVDAQVLCTYMFYAYVCTYVIKERLDISIEKRQFTINLTLNNKFSYHSEEKEGGLNRLAADHKQLQQKQLQQQQLAPSPRSRTDGAASRPQNQPLCKNRIDRGL